MASLKDLKNRIKSVKSTQKITKAMKMVAAAKLRRAQEAAQAARPFAEQMANVLASLGAGITATDSASPLLVGNGKTNRVLLIVATGDRGLCGAFNSSIVRASRRRITQLLGEGKEVFLYTVGRKGYEQLRFEHGGRIIERRAELGKSGLKFADARAIADDVLRLFAEDKFDVVEIVYNHFKSAILQIVTFQQLIPLPPVQKTEAQTTALIAPYEYEPSEEAVLTELLPRNVATQIFKAMLENAASEQGARMSAMDNATRNAGDMIGRLTLVYNRTRQAAITRELIEIISGAEAL